MKSEYLTNSAVRKTILLLLSVLYIILMVIDALGNNHGEDKMTNPTIKEIIYHFGDASVPPEYHRSYTIVITAEKVRIVVDSYGEILADELYGITSKQFDNIRKSLERNKIKNCTLGDDEGCSGGTFERISYSDNENEIFSGTVYHCGENDTGNFCGDITGFVDDVKKMVPNLDKLLL